MTDLNEEGYGHSAHNWSSYQRVGSLSRIGLTAENKGTFSKNNENAPGQSGAFFVSGD